MIEVLLQKNTINIIFIILVFFVTTITPVAAGSSKGAIFFIFSASKFDDSAGEQRIFELLRSQVTSADYIGERLAHALPDVAARVGAAHVVIAPASTAAVLKNLACGPSKPGLVLYDPEHWPGTPADEQSNLAGAVSRIAKAINDSGCHTAGVAPDGRFVGIEPAACSWDLAKSVFGRMPIDGFTLINIQAQALLGDPCVRRSGETASSANYVAFVTAATGEIRKRSPNVIVTAQLSFRATPPNRMLAAIRALRSVVDGFYIAYPPGAPVACTWCSPAALATVLSAFHR